MGFLQYFSKSDEYKIDTTKGAGNTDCYYDFAVTINPSPYKKIDRRLYGEVVDIKYGELTNDQQRLILDTILNNEQQHLIVPMVWHYEVNTRGNLHAHGLVKAKPKEIKRFSESITNHVGYGKSKNGQECVLVKIASDIKGWLRYCTKDCKTDADLDITLPENFNPFKKKSNNNTILPQKKEIVSK